MRDLAKFYIDGKWTEPHGRGRLNVINPANEEAFAVIALGDETDVDRAVKAARVQNQALRPNVIAASAKRNGRAEICQSQIGVAMPANMSGICGGNHTAKNATNGTATPIGSSAQR